MSPKTPKQFQEIREKSKEHLMEVSMKLFATKGYQNTSISQIAKEAGVAKGALYHYFESKEVLLISVIKKGIQNIEHFFSETAKIDDDPKEQLKLLLKKTFESVQSNKEYWSLYTSLITQMQNSDALKKLFEPLVESSYNMLITLLEKCEIPNARIRALSIGGMIDGIILHYLFVKNDYPIEEVTAYIVDEMLFPKN